MMDDVDVDVDVIVRPLAWGNDDHMDAIELELQEQNRRVTHVLGLDLVSRLPGTFSIHFERD